MSTKQHKDIVAKTAWVIYRYKHRVQLGWSIECVQRKEDWSQKHIRKGQKVLDLHYLIE